MRALLTALFVVNALPALAADWPMWRHDASRSAVSAEPLPDELHLQWVRPLPPQTPAWPNEPRLDFDISHEPIVMGQRLFVASADLGCVLAFDTGTGAEQWRFYADDPVRFAPVGWQGKLYVGSDDGYLYCLAADTGKPLWKVRGCPDDRPDRRHLGNNRLISHWPVRGGPVLAGGAVYFAAGIWPTHGVFILAVDAETGEVLWRNDDSGLLESVRIDHNQLHEAGLAPQGYLAVSGDTLLVPNGRSMPARFNRHTGERLYYVQGYRNGAARVVVAGDYALVGNDGVINISDGREAGSRWAEAGDDAPDTFVHTKLDLFEGPFLPYKMFPACNARSVVDPAGTIYGMHAGEFVAFDLTGAALSTYDADRGSGALKPGRWDVPEAWKLPTGHAGVSPSGLALVKAGDRVYGHSGTFLSAADVSDPGKPSIAWEREIEGTPTSMCAADVKLFVVTGEDDLYCFGGEAADPVTHSQEQTPLPEREDRWTKAAEGVLADTGAREGFCILLGIGSGRLLEELLSRSDLRVIAVDPNPKKVRETREWLADAGVYGTRVEVLGGEPAEFPFPPYIADIITSENLRRAGVNPQAPPKSLLEALRPYGGTLYRARPGGGGEVLACREGPLPGAAPWTHETADASRTYFSRDQLVRAPLGVLWYGDGLDHGFFKHKDYGVGVKPQVVGGRLFGLQIFSSTLHAVDVYTGRLLWKARVDPFTRYASLEDGVYVAGGNRCVVHDPATGEVLRELPYAVPGMATPFVADIRVTDDLILVAIAPEKSRAIEKGLWDSTALVALDRAGGELLWTHEAGERFNNHAIAVGDGTAFCVDSPAAGESAKLDRRGDAPETMPSTILALDARTGDERWRREYENPFRTYPAGNWLGLRANDDWLAYAGEVGVLLTGKEKELRGLDAKTGDELWHKQVGGGQPMVILGSTFMTQAMHIYDLRTGELIEEAPPYPRGGCNYAVAGEHLIFRRHWSVSYVDRETHEKRYLRNIRSGCSNSLVAADGLLNAPCFSVKCVCNYPIQTSFAMVYMPEIDTWSASP